MQSHLGKLAKVIIFFAVGLIVLYFVYQRQDVAFQADCAMKGTPQGECSLIGKVAKDMSGANYFWVLTTLFIFMLSNVLRAYRWKMLLQPLGYQPRIINLIGTLMVNYLANLGIPRSGEVIRAGLIAEYENIPVEKAFGTIVTDRIFDVIMLGIAIGLALLFGGSDFIAYLDQNINISAKFQVILDHPLWIFILVFVGIGTSILMYKYRKTIQSSKIGKKVIGMVSGFLDGIKSIKDIKNIPLFIFYTVGIWVCYYFMTYVAFFSFAPTEHLGPIAGLVVFVFGSLGIVIPTPGGMGSYHFLVGEALSMYGINDGDAFSFANIVFFSIQIFINVFLGLLSFILLPLINRKNE